MRLWIPGFAIAGRLYDLVHNVAMDLVAAHSVTLWEAEGDNRGLQGAATDE